MVARLVGKWDVVFALPGEVGVQVDTMADVDDKKQSFL
jgi:hypothetical protein